MKFYAKRSVTAPRTDEDGAMTFVKRGPYDTQDEARINLTAMILAESTSADKIGLTARAASLVKAANAVYDGQDRVEVETPESINGNLVFQIISYEG